MRVFHHGLRLQQNSRAIVIGNLLRPFVRQQDIHMFVLTLLHHPTYIIHIINPTFILPILLLPNIRHPIRPTDSQSLYYSHPFPAQEYKVLSKLMSLRICKVQHFAHRPGGDEVCGNRDGNHTFADETELLCSLEW